MYDKNKQKLKLCKRNKAMNFFLAFLGSDDNRTNKNADLDKSQESCLQRYNI